MVKAGVKRTFYHLFPRYQFFLLKTGKSASYNFGYNSKLHASPILTAYLI